MIAPRAAVSLLVALVLLAIPGAPGMADQTDPRLDELFVRLRGAQSGAEAAPVERAIWMIWLRADEPEVDRNLEVGMRAMDRGDGAAALAAFDAVVGAAPLFAEGWNKRCLLYTSDAADE